MDNVYFVAAAWIGLALVASLISIRVGISVALVEILVGVLAGNFTGLRTNDWIDVLATFGAGLLTFLAGAEIDPQSLRRHIRMSLSIGLISFAVPFVAAFAFAYFVAGWDFQASEIAGIALSTTSVAVVYAVMIESGQSNTDLGKTILAACFITDLGTVVALGVLFAQFDLMLVLFVAATAIGLGRHSARDGMADQARAGQGLGTRDQVPAAGPVRSWRPREGGRERSRPAGVPGRPGCCRRVRR